MIRRLWFIYTVLLPLAGAYQEPAETATRPVRFFPLDVYVDSGTSELAAYQFELKATGGDVKIVGVEGGEHAAFANAPYYDPQALAQDRIIIAAFSTASDLPQGRTRVATLHLQAEGDAAPEYELILTVSADAQGDTVEATITCEQGELR